MQKLSIDDVTINDFAYLERASHFARTEDPRTSHEAAESVEDPAGIHHYRIWMTLVVNHGLTSEELLDELGDRATSPGGTRTRVKRLEEEGWVYYDGDERETRSGRMARVIRPRLPDHLRLPSQPNLFKTGEANG